MDMESADVVVDILRRLPQRSIAAFRSVCTAWRAVIDDHRLLHADLLPLSVDGVIYDTTEPESPRLFSRLSTSRAMTSALDYLDVERPVQKNNWWPMLDHCNGLLLLDDHMVANPATRQWARLPQLPLSCTLTGCTPCWWQQSDRFLIYDPTVSPHYDVFAIPRIPLRTTNHECFYESVSTMEWPPSPYVISVFSSRTGCWKERSYIREGDAAGIVADLKFSGRSQSILFHSAYWRGALYVGWQYDFLLRINLLDDKYRIIELPVGNKGLPRLGKSKNGVYCSVLERCKCQVWFLDESQGQMKWVLKNEINLDPAVTKCPRAADGPWDLQSFDEMEWLLKNEVNFKATDECSKALVVQDDFEWDSDDENCVSAAGWPPVGECCGSVPPPYFHCLGFHPYKEIALFHDGSDTTVAYHFNSSKVRYLGKMWVYHQEIEASFAYTPCWTRDLPGSN